MRLKKSVTLFFVLQPELEIQLSVNESVFKGAHADETNIINITAESLYSPPESWNMSAGYNYVAATAVPLAGEVYLSYHSCNLSTWNCTEDLNLNLLSASSMSA